MPSSAVHCGRRASFVTCVKCVRTRTKPRRVIKVLNFVCIVLDLSVGVSIRGSVAREAGGVVLDAIIGHSRGGGISMRVSVARGVGTSGAELKTIPNTDGIKQYPLTLTLVLMHGVGDGGA